MTPLNILYSQHYESREPGVISSFALNKYFQFIRCGSVEELTKVANSFDKNYVLCRTSDISRFVSMFSPLTVTDLRALAVCHNLSTMNRKPELLRALMEHSCKLTCELDCLLFKQIIRPRPGPFIVRTLPPVLLQLTLEQVNQLCNGVKQTLHLQDHEAIWILVCQLSMIFHGMLWCYSPAFDQGKWKQELNSLRDKGTFNL